MTKGNDRDPVLVQLSKAEQALEAAVTATEVQDIRKMAEAARVLAVQSSMGVKAVNHATRVKLLADQKLAEVVDAGQAAGEIATPDRNRGVRPSDTSITLPELGIDRRRLAEARALRDFVDPDEIDWNADKVISWGDLTKSARAGKAKTEYQKKQEQWDYAANIVGERYTLRQGDFRQVLADIEPGTIDAIVTDPPYPDEFLPLWGELADLAAKLLRPGAPLIAWSGQFRLQQVLNHLCGPLTYQWTICLDLPGSNARFRGPNFIQTWKPVIVCTAGAWGPHDWFRDRVTSPAKDQELYEWQQNPDPAVDLIERYVPPGGLILDPFLGVGSFGEAALRSGRRFIGTELDEGRYAESAHRLGTIA